MLNLESFLSGMPDEKMLQIEDEIMVGVVPATGITHATIRHVNHLIDKGVMCINATLYRKVYLPTFSKAVHKEMARRYCKLFEQQGGHYVRANSSCEV